MEAETNIVLGPPKGGGVSTPPLAHQKEGDPGTWLPQGERNLGPALPRAGGTRDPGPAVGPNGENSCRRGGRQLQGGLDPKKNILKASRQSLITNLRPF